MPGRLLDIAERALLRPLDQRAESEIAAAAKRVSLVTAISPRAILDVVFVVAQIVRLVRRIAEIYGYTEISERHRHRYEVNTAYRARLEAKGLVFAGMSPDGLLPETVEFADHPWFIGVQFHPELKSRPFEPHPLFASFIAAAKAQSRLV